MTKKYYGYVVTLLVLTLSWLPSIGAGAQPGVFVPVRGVAELIGKVNDLRSAQGLTPYAQNSILMSLAQTHAVYVSSTGVLTNFDQQGKRPYERALDAGYLLAGNLSTGGFLTQVIYSGKGVSDDDVITAWQSNPADSSVLLSPDYQDVGVGIAAADGITYFVLIAASQTGDLITSTPFLGTGTPTLLAGNGLPNTPLPGGEVYHTVQKDEALWSIALAYGSTIAELKLINHLASDEIFEGQKLLIRSANTVTPTFTEVPVTATLGLSTSTPTLPVTPTITNTPTPLPTPPSSMQNGEKVVGGIVLAALVLAGLFSFLGKRKPNVAD